MQINKKMFILQGLLFSGFLIILTMINKGIGYIIAIGVFLLINIISLYYLVSSLEEWSNKRDKTIIRTINILEEEIALISSDFENIIGKYYKSEEHNEMICNIKDILENQFKEMKNVNKDRENLNLSITKKMLQFEKDSNENYKKVNYTIKEIDNNAKNQLEEIKEMQNIIWKDNNLGKEKIIQKLEIYKSQLENLNNEFQIIHKSIKGLEENYDEIEEKFNLISEKEIQEVKMVKNEILMKIKDEELKDIFLLNLNRINKNLVKSMREIKHIINKKDNEKEREIGFILKNSMEKLEELIINYNNVLKKDNEEQEEVKLIKDENGIKYLFNNRIIRYEEEDGTITDFIYEGDDMKESKITKNGELAMIITFDNGNIVEAKHYDGGKNVHRYVYNIEGIPVEVSPEK